MSWRMLIKLYLILTHIGGEGGGGGWGGMGLIVFVFGRGGGILELYLSLKALRNLTRNHRRQSAK